MLDFKADYSTRLLYKQKYTTEDGYHVASIMYAVLWSFNTDITPTTTRVRLTLIYNYESGIVQPVQGLIEQWKSDGWVMLDEFVSITTSFNTEEEYEEQLMKMVRSFLLGVPIDANIIAAAPVPDQDPIKKGSGFTGRITKILSRDTGTPELFKEQPTKKKPSVEEKEDSLEKEKAKKEKPKTTRKKKKDEDSDEDWC